MKLLVKRIRHPKATHLVTHWKFQEHEKTSKKIKRKKIKLNMLNNKNNNQTEEKKIPQVLRNCANARQLFLKAKHEI